LRPEYAFDDSGTLEATTIVAIEAGALCGFAITGPSRDAGHEGAGEVSALYVDPARWGLGIGRTLIEEARGRLVRQGYAAAGLWILSGNRRAQRFCGIDGWQADGARRLQVFAETAIDEVRYGRSLA